jgi:hypothetical protein
MNGINTSPLDVINVHIEFIEDSQLVKASRRSSHVRDCKGVLFYDLSQYHYANKYFDKSFLKWDYRQNSANTSLEFIVGKTIAGFLNCEGRKLIIEVNDNTEIIGLKKIFLF